MRRQFSSSGAGALQGWSKVIQGKPGRMKEWEDSAGWGINAGKAMEGKGKGGRKRERKPEMDRVRERWKNETEEAMEGEVKQKSFIKGDKGQRGWRRRKARRRGGRWGRALTRHWWKWNLIMRFWTITSSTNSRYWTNQRNWLITFIYKFCSTVWVQKLYLK